MPTTAKKVREKTPYCTWKDAYFVIRSLKNTDYLL